MAGNVGFGFEIVLKDKYSRTAKSVVKWNKRMVRGFKGVNRGLSRMSALVPGVVKGGLAIGAAYVGIVKPMKEYVKFEEELNKVYKLIADPKDFAKSRRQTEMMGKAMRDMSEVYGVKAVESVQGLWEVLTRGGKPGKEAVEVMDQLLKATVATDVASKDLAATTATIWKNFGKEVGDAYKISADFFAAQMVSTGTVEDLVISFRQSAPFAAKLGLSYQEVVAALAAITHTAPSVEVAGTQLKNMMKSMLQPSEEVRRRFAATGIDMSKSAIKARGLMATLNLLEKTTERIKFTNIGLGLKDLGLKFPAVAFQGRNLVRTAAIITNEMSGKKFAAVRDSMDLIGLSISRADWNAKNLEERFVAIFNALRDQKGIVQFFPNIRGASAVLGIMGKAKSVFFDAMDRMGVSTKVLNEAFASAMKTTAQRMRVLRSRWTEMQLKIGEKLLKPGGPMEKVIKMVEGINFDKLFIKIEKGAGIVKDVVLMLYGLGKWVIKKFMSPVERMSMGVSLLGSVFGIPNIDALTQTDKQPPGPFGRRAPGGLLVPAFPDMFSNPPAPGKPNRAEKVIRSAPSMGGSVLKFILKNLPLVSASPGQEKPMMDRKMVATANKRALSVVSGLTQTSGTVALLNDTMKQVAGLMQAITVDKPPARAPERKRPKALALNLPESGPPQQKVDVKPITLADLRLMVREMAGIMNNRQIVVRAEVDERVLFEAVTRQSDLEGARA